MTRVADGWDDLCFLCYSDAAFAVRSDNSSQGGFVILLTSNKALEGEATDYNLLSWRSFKLTRVCRSSLAAEAQACASAVDELMLLKTMISLMRDPDQDPKDPATARWLGQSAVVIDAKALYDSLKKKGFSSQQDRRSAIEIMCIQQEIERLGTQLRWVSSEQMLADGMTEISARQTMCGQLRARRLRLREDPSFTAAKKKTPEERSKSMAEAFGTKAYGSRVARHISTILALNCVTPTASQDLNDTNDYLTYVIDLGDYGIIALGENTILIMVSFLVFGTIMHLIYYLWKNCVSNGGCRSRRRTVDTKDVMVQRNDDFERLQRLWHAQGVTNARLRDQIQEQRDTITSLWNRVRNPPPPPQPHPVPIHDPVIHHTQAGQVFHTQRSCGHIATHIVKTLRKCRDCP